MEKETFVYAELDGDTRPVGRLWTRMRQGRESATFQYDDAWLDNPGRFALEPALSLGPGAHHTRAGKALFGADDGDVRSYLEIADALRQHGAESRADREALWKRIVFSILISNTDDHLRNHGFLCEGTAGWRLSPAYDLNPVPVDLKPRFLSTAVNLEDHEASLELALSVAPYFGLGENAARAVARNVALSVAEWRAVASSVGLTRGAIERMASAFDHDDLKGALAS